MSQKISYELNSEFVEILEKEFPLTAIIQEYQQALEKNSAGLDVDPEVVGTYGRKVAQFICQIEKNYRDRNAEVIYLIAEKTGHAFPSIQQRLIEIVLISVLYGNRMKFRETSFKRLAYEISRCVMHEALKEKVGSEIANRLPCRYFCLELLKGICEFTGLKDVTTIDMTDKITEGRGCLFSAELTIEEQLRLMHQPSRSRKQHPEPVDQGHDHHHGDGHHHHHDHDHHHDHGEGHSHRHDHGHDHGHSHDHDHDRKT